MNVILKYIVKIFGLSNLLLSVWELAKNQLERLAKKTDSDFDDNSIIVFDDIIKTVVVDLGTNTVNYIGKNLKVLLLYIIKVIGLDNLIIKVWTLCKLELQKLVDNTESTWDGELLDFVDKIFFQIIQEIKKD